MPADDDAIIGRLAELERRIGMILRAIDRQTDVMTSLAAPDPHNRPNQPRG